MSGLLLVFFTVLLAELGDKTQIATLMFTAQGERSPLLVFVAAALALTVASGLAVIVGVAAARWLEFVPMKLVSGIVFLVLGVWSILEHLRS